MDAKELRLGNLVQTFQGVYKVTSIKENEIYICPFLTEEPFVIFINSVNPIPLTEKFLLKLGFSNIQDDRFYHEDFDRLYCNISNPLIKYLGNANGILKETNFVHELQNLFYAITSKELTLKK